MQAVLDSIKWTPELGLGLAEVVVYVAIAGLAAFRLVKTNERLLVFWLVYNGLTHFLMEGRFVYYSLTTTAENATGPLAHVWKEYGAADVRWLWAEQNIVAMEIVTVLLDGSLCFAIIWAIKTHSPNRHFMQVVLCTCELYGNWMTFAPEWLSGNKNLTDDPFKVWFHLFFFNFLWVVFPLLMLIQSYKALSHPKVIQSRKTR
ncbi:hypothetical protein BOX15_Mlig009609g1 [Macrostomum lignano]|uniref:EXPERA domain-containing protein n=2 Tax=Macrostomum lignano TaxID=282301 RepID=A0A1I8J419_9PLAT|nr:hypothetical protein BOX15_Mlig009609g1 [Macrostomum lignano]